MKRIIAIWILLVVFVAKSLGQGCSVCTKTASGLGAESAQGLNNGILYLAALPLLFLGTLGFIWYKRNKSSF